MAKNTVTLKACTQSILCSVVHILPCFKSTYQSRWIHERADANFAWCIITSQYILYTGLLNQGCFALPIPAIEWTSIRVKRKSRRLPTCWEFLSCPDNVAHLKVVQLLFCHGTTTSAASLTDNRWLNESGHRCTVTICMYYTWKARLVLKTGCHNDITTTQRQWSYIERACLGGLC